MLTPAVSATRLVVKASSPSVSIMRVAAWRIAAQVARTREELGSRPFLLTPSCALPPRFLNDTDLRAFAQAGRSNS